MFETTDILGLRAQILANAKFIFPGQDIDVVVCTNRGSGHEAVITDPTEKKLLAGYRLGGPVEALKSLLEVTEKRVGAMLRRNA
jgi:hypothetical protein